MQTFSQNPSAPITLEPSTEAKVYGLLTIAMALTVVGVFFGIIYGPMLMSLGLQVFFLLAELVLIFTSGFWSRRSPLNIILFGLFPILSGFTITPYLLSLLVGFENGGMLILNAVVATVFMTAAAAVFAKTTSINLAGMRGVLFMGLIGLIVIGILQIFLPALQQFELLISGAGIILFSFFIAFDIQRAQVQARAGGNAFLLALSLYLDIFNLFLYILRFMQAFSGNRR